MCFETSKEPQAPPSRRAVGAFHFDGSRAKTSPPPGSFFSWPYISYAQEYTKLVMCGGVVTTSRLLPSVRFFFSGFAGRSFEDCCLLAAGGRSVLM